MLELAGKSQAYLNRIFYKYYGQTPTAFINLSYFNRQFRARYGQTPKEYRSQKRFFE